MQNMILLEVHRRHGYSAICIKYYSSFYIWLISPNPKQQIPGKKLIIPKKSTLRRKNY